MRIAEKEFCMELGLKKTRSYVYKYRVCSLEQPAYKRVIIILLLHVRKMQTMTVH